MAHCSLYKMFPSLDIDDIPGYPNHFSPIWEKNCPKFDGNSSLAITYVVNFLKYFLEIDVTH
jgi:hypothetical protein